MTNNQPVHNHPQPRLFGLAALLSLGGLADSIYLTVTHLTGENVTCIASSGCSEVLASAYASVGKIPLGAFGALGYFVAFSLATLAACGYPRARTFLTVVVAGMFATTLWLLYVQAFVLHAFCDYCLLSAALTTSLSVIVAVGFFTRLKHRTAGGQAPSLES
jgi:uncharacterized membrane protein